MTIKRSWSRDTRGLSLTSAKSSIVRAKIRLNPALGWAPDPNGLVRMSFTMKGSHSIKTDRDYGR